MSFMDAFKGNQYKSELEKANAECERLKALLTPEMADAANLEKRVADLNEQAQRLSTQLLSGKNTLDNLNATIVEKRKQIYGLDDEIAMQEFGLYRPRFSFANALIYKDRLSELRAHQKDLIRANKAITGDTAWTVNGSAKEGKKMVADMQKLMLTAFNSECDAIISKVTYSNVDKSYDQINKIAAKITNLGRIQHIAITHEYLKAKTDELYLAFEYQQKKEAEKEEQKAARAEQREQAKLQKEIEEQRHKLEKEQTHYQSAMEHLLAQLAKAPDDAALLAKKDEYEAQLGKIEQGIKDVDYREANIKAGYVYIISNIGSFGKDVYKIGMTRRLDPQERVDELGDASVPFNFDVHALIFSADAPALEAALHRAFADRKVNMVNQRREFFHVTLDEIKAVIQANYDKTVEFVDVPDAEQYRVSEKMRQHC